MTLDNICKEIKESKSIIILAHKDPDGDAIGSSLAMYLALKQINLNVDIVMPVYPRIYGFLPGATEIKKEGNSNNYDLAIALDCGDRGRLGDCIEYFDKANKTISIDHHGTNKMFADYNYVNPDSCATAQSLFVVLNFMGINITKEIAECLYAGILTDTGGFKYSSVTEETFEIAKELFSKGINIADISKKMLDTITKPQLLLTKIAIGRLEVLEDGKIAFTYITKNESEEVNAENGDYEGIVNYGRNLEGVEVSVFLRETDDGFKVSLRSNSYVDVSDVALIFGGGGHKKASGCLINTPLEDAKTALVKEIKRYL